VLPSCSFDGGAVRLVHDTGSPVTVGSVVLRFPAACAHDIWPHDVALPASFRYASLSIGPTPCRRRSPAAGPIASAPVQVAWTVPFAPGGGAFVAGGQRRPASTRAPRARPGRRAVVARLPPGG